jgi:hypothetical protein
MLTTVTIERNGGAIIVEKTFPAIAPCASTHGCFGPEERFPIFPGEPFTIDAKQGSPPAPRGVTPPGPGPWILAGIVFTGEHGTCSQLGIKQAPPGHCTGIWSNHSGIITVDVNYYWVVRAPTSPPSALLPDNTGEAGGGDEGDNSGDSP